MHIYHFLGRNILYNWSASVIVKNQKVNGMWQSYKNLRKKELFVVKTKYLCYILEYSVKCRKVPGGQVERTDREVETNKLFEAEWNLMDIVWENAPVTASRVSAIAGQRFGWAKNTTYTVLKRLIAKGVIQRGGNDFTVTPLVSRQQIRRGEACALLDKRFQGDAAGLLETLLEAGSVPPEQLPRLRKLLDQKQG